MLCSIERNEFQYRDEYSFEVNRKEKLTTFMLRNDVNPNDDYKHDKTELNLPSTVQKTTDSQFRPLNLVKKIKLANDILPLEVGMFEKEVIVLSQPTDKVFLFTTGLGPCIAALAFCCNLVGTIYVAKIFFK